jgi:hypothetical protein
LLRQHRLSHLGRGGKHFDDLVRDDRVPDGIDNTGTTTYCLTVLGDDNNGDTMDAQIYRDVGCEAIARGAVSLSYGGVGWSSGETSGAPANFTIDSDVSATTADAIYLFCTVPECQISSGGCDSYTDEISYISLYDQDDGGACS